MPGLVLLGAQWGDEGKGKVTDYLAERAIAEIGKWAKHKICQGHSDSPQNGNEVRGQERMDELLRMGY